MSKDNSKQSTKSFSSRFFKTLIVVLVLSMGIFFFLAPAFFEDKMNGVVQLPPYKASQKAI